MRSVFLLLLTLGHALHGQTFGWARIDPVTLYTNPLLLLNTLAADSSGRVIRARLIGSRRTAMPWDLAGHRSPSLPYPAGIPYPTP